MRGASSLLIYTPLVSLSFSALTVSESVSRERHITLIADHYDGLLIAIVC
jgi:hypothetical protein